MQQSPLAESVTGLFKTELIKPRGPGGLLSRRNRHPGMGRLVQPQSAIEACGDIPPVELEQAHYRQHVALTEAGRVCCVQPDGTGVGCGGGAGHMACASSVNAVARRSGGKPSVASS